MMRWPGLVFDAADPGVGGLFQGKGFLEFFS